MASYTKTWLKYQRKERKVALNLTKNELLLLQAAIGQLQDKGGLGSLMETMGLNDPALPPEKWCWLSSKTRVALEKIGA